MKKVAATLLVIALALASTAAPALAGWDSRRRWGNSAARHRWEGAALAIGALGFLTILSEAARPYEAGVSISPTYGPPEAYYDPRPLQRQRAWSPGRWVTAQVWVPGHWEQVWEPECYDRYGSYRRGRFVEREVAGRYETRLVWR